MNRSFAETSKLKPARAHDYHDIDAGKTPDSEFRGGDDRGI